MASVSDPTRRPQRSGPVNETPHRVTCRLCEGSIKQMDKGRFNVGANYSSRAPVFSSK